MSRLRRIVQVSLLVTPVLITTYDQIGYVGIVRGCSMQVRNFREFCILRIPRMPLYTYIAYTKSSKLKMDRLSFN